MKLETSILIAKGCCLTYIPAGTALSAGLPELGVATLFGVPVKFWTLAFAASVAGASGLLAFFSQSFGDFMTKRAANGNTDFALKPQPPKP